MPEVRFIHSHVPARLRVFLLPVAMIRNEKLEVSDWTAGPGGESDDDQGE